MSFQPILTSFLCSLFLSATAPSLSLMKQHANKNISRSSYIEKSIKSFLVILLILYPMKALKAFWFPDFFRKYEIGALARNGLI